ncbi:mitogen-activated protein kinase kinase kinase [Martiniozyma asiatica (nom. inval.)]|nr:mitogen-activated protein kinase kinase kinase [Martiniozyma asiatica]
MAPPSKISHVHRRQPRRVWVKRPDRTPTSFHVEADDIVDDLKYMITNKFPNSIQHSYDAADLIIKVPVTNSPSKVLSRNHSPFSDLNMMTMSNKQGNVELHAPSPLAPTKTLLGLSPSPTSGNFSSPASLNNSSVDLINRRTPVHEYNRSILNSAQPATNNLNSAKESKKKQQYTILQPDILVWQILDMYFPSGQPMQSAFLIDLADDVKPDSQSSNLEINSSSTPMHLPVTSNSSSSNLPTVNSTRGHLSNLNIADKFKEREFPTQAQDSSNLTNSLSSSYPFSKMAVIGESKVPPPRFRNGSFETSSNSAVIMFPSDGKKLRQKLPREKSNNEFFGEKLQKSSSAESRNKSLGLRVNTDPCIEEDETQNKNDETEMEPLIRKSALTISAPAPTPLDSASNNQLSATSVGSITSNTTLTPSIISNNNISGSTLNNIPYNLESENSVADINSNSNSNSNNNSNSNINGNANSNDDDNKNNSIGHGNGNGNVNGNGNTISNNSMAKLNNHQRTHTVQIKPVLETSSMVRLNKEKKKNQSLGGVSKILNHLNVLVVEDNLVNQKIMARHLKSCNVRFSIAKTGKEALEMWKEGGFHLCFMDIQLPVMSGIQVTKEIRRLERLYQIGRFANNTRKIGENEEEENGEITEDDMLDVSLFRSPIIIVALTASSSVADQQNALAAGCNDFLTKPVQLKWLRSKLMEWGCMQALINFDYFRNESS